MEIKLSPENHNNKDTDTPFTVEDKFSLDRVPSSETASLIQRQLSPYEKVYILKDRSYVVWDEGPEKDRVYRELDKPTNEQIATLPKIEEIKSVIVSKLEVTEKLMAEFEVLNKEKDDRKYEVAAIARQNMADLYIYLHQIYYGDEDTLGLEEAQLFDLSGEGQKYYEFLQEINPPPVDWAVQVRNPKNRGYKAYLQSVAESHGFTHIHQGGVDNEERKAFNRYYYGKDEVHDNNFTNPTDPVVLTHSTYGDTLTKIIQLRGLASKNYAESHGIQKRSGGEGGGPGSYTGGDVSFWSYPDGNTHIVGGHGSKVGFEYPMVFGIDQSHQVRLSTYPGTMNGEIVIQNFVPLREISYVFVPKFKVSEVQEIFRSHNYTNIKVLPLGIPA